MRLAPSAAPGPSAARRAGEALDEEEPPQGYGTADEDARLRDFSINALFYDPIDERIVDFVDGMRDLRGRVLRAIGEPVKRMVEDPCASCAPSSPRPS